MNGRRLFSWLARGALIAAAVSSVSLGCSDQGEGERCSFLNAGNTDCEEGLVCVICNELQDSPVDRCCPVTPGAESDERCRRGLTRVAVCSSGAIDSGTAGEDGTGGSSASGGTSSSGGSSGTSSGGAAGIGGAAGDGAGATAGAAGI